MSAKPHNLARELFRDHAICNFNLDEIIHRVLHVYVNAPLTRNISLILYLKKSNFASVYNTWRAKKVESDTAVIKFQSNS